MRAYSISPDIKLELMEIGLQMKQSGLSNVFVADAVETAFEFEGVYDLMKMWTDEDDPKEQSEIVADLQELIIECKQAEKTEEAFVRINDLESISKNIMAFKDSLRLKVEDHGGLGNLAQKTGIPQPSLSRFFNTPSIPHRATLLKIAKALGLSQIEIATQWVR